MNNNNIHPSHQRRESADTAPSHAHHSGRGGMQGGAGRGNRAYGPNNHHQQYNYNNNAGYGRGGYPTNPNQSRGQPMHTQHTQPYQPGPATGGYNPHSPRLVNRSPAMSHVSPALPHVQPVGTAQLYPPQQHYNMGPPQQQVCFFFPFIWVFFDRVVNFADHSYSLEDCKLPCTMTISTQCISTRRHI
jgi:hypothetical protein